MKQIFTSSDKQSMQACLYLLANLHEGYQITVEKVKRQRTGLQNNSIHKYCELLALSMNDAGYDKQAVYKLMKQGFSIPWQTESVKTDLWHPIQHALFNIESSAKLETSQVSDVYLALNNWTNEKLGISLSFPNRHEL